MEKAIEGRTLAESVCCLFRFHTLANLEHGKLQ